MRFYWFNLQSEAMSGRLWRPMVGVGEWRRRRREAAPMMAGGLGTGRQANRCCKHGLAVDEVSGFGGGFGIEMAGLWIGWRLVFWGRPPEDWGSGQSGETNPGIFNIVPFIRQTGFRVGIG